MQRLIVALLVGIIVVCSFCKTSSPTAKPSSSSVAIQPNVSKIPYYPLSTMADLDVLITSMGDARIVLLGEDTHGTSEYYVWRAAFTERLLKEKGFNLVALEADWIDTYRLNELLDSKQRDSLQVHRMLQRFDRWPTWLWANKEFAHFLLRTSDYTAAGGKVNIYGLDVFSFEEALDTLIRRSQDQRTLQIAQNVKRCLSPFENNAIEYQKAVRAGKANCGDAVNRLYLAINSSTGTKKGNSEAAFLLKQNARVVFNGERYFRQTSFNPLSPWNVRDRHMAETVAELLQHYGSNSKTIVWAHNSHVGDARFTDMPARGRSNIGEMLRKDFSGENVFIVGFGSYKGSVIAAQKWDSIYQKMQFSQARAGSIEQILHDAAAGNKVVLMKEVQNNVAFEKWLTQRAIGVVESPRGGLLGSYVPSQIQNRYDAYIYFDETHPLHPLK